MATRIPLIESMPAELIDDPLNWIFADHFRQRQVCAILDHLVSSTDVLPEAIAAASAYLKIDMPLHVQDEEEDLFPLIRKRCVPEDEIEGVLSRLARDHEQDKDQAVETSAILDAALQAGYPISRDGQSASRIKAFARHQRDHLIMENAVLLPIARLRLKPEDLQELSRAMAARRGIAQSGTPVERD